MRVGYIVPNMKTDIEKIISHLHVEHPDVRIRQLKVTHKADDDGIWFFSVEDSTEVQLESSTYNFPFLVESNMNKRRTTVGTVEEAIPIICKKLGIC